jgi:hypothetical protein
MHFFRRPKPRAYRYTKPRTAAYSAAKQATVAFRLLVLLEHPQRSSFRATAVSYIIFVGLLTAGASYSSHILMQLVGSKWAPKSTSVPAAPLITSAPDNGVTTNTAAPAATIVSTSAPKPTTTVASRKSAPVSVKKLPGRVDPVCVSTHIDRLAASDVNRQTSIMQAMGVNWVRFDVTWAAIEQTKGKYSWADYDYDVNSVTSKGMKVLAIMTQYGLPTWERIDQSNWSSTPNNMQDYQNFVYAFAAHYKGKITLYEIGNEPNVSQFWPSGPDPQAYTNFLVAGYKGVKAANPAAKVISAGLANISAAAFLQGMYNAGAKGHFDYVGFHPYSWPNSPDYTAGATSFSQTANIRQVMASNGQGTKQIMATEVGWPSTTASGGVDESTQAAYISRLYQKIVNEDYRYVPLACVYDLINDGTDTSNNEDNFGLLRADYSQKSSFASMKAARRNFNAIFSPVSP